MLNRIDDFLIGAAGRAAGWAEDRFEITLPALLRECLTAAMVAYFGVVLKLLLSGSFLSALIILATLPIAAPTTLKQLRRYQTDAQKPWSSDLARSYMARAIGRRESMRTARGITFVLTIFVTALNATTIVSGRFEPSAYIFAAFWLVALAHEYLSAAEPLPPGQRRRQASLTLATHSAQ
ncbi:hypothetical protein [Terrarubrum flagellatum]|uniref:hypothetical protein n=1 Tax=Terrirubrum flagellatum TaxID=2895980 RepID=UPI0031453168